METTNHTPGGCKVIATSSSEVNTIVVDDASWFGGMRVIAMCDSEAIAARIADCVNACAGMTDEQVSHGLVSASVFSSVVNQRDELLKNLRFAVDLLTPIAGHTVQIERMRKAISAVEQHMEGGAS